MAAALVALGLPPRRRALTTRWSDGSIPGILHVHTNRSDGSLGAADIATAAARAGLRFIVFTDHGDATRTPDPPVYRDGVLCLDAVEISTSGGHYIAFDMPAAPYPLAGEPRDVVEDVRRLGGFGIVAHPDSPKPALRWTDWSVPFDGIEALNLDSSWRRFVALARGSDGTVGGRWRGAYAIAAALFAYPFRSPETIARLTSADDGAAIRQHDAPERRVVITAGADAHAHVTLRGDQWDTHARWALPIPSYESTFRTMSIHASLERPLSGDAAADARMLARAVREGHLYIALDAVGAPSAFDFSASNALGTVHEGDELGEGGPVTLRVHSNAPPTFTTSIWDGARLVTGERRESDFSIQVPGAPAAYTVEIRATDRQSPVPWVLSNAIRVRSRAPREAPPRAPIAGSVPLFEPRRSDAWYVEHDPSSRGTLDVEPATTGAELCLQYTLGGGPPSGQYVGLVRNTPDGVPSSDRLRIAARADRPMRVSIQLRRLSAGGAERWQRSIYVGPNQAEHTLFFRDFMPYGSARGPAPPPQDIKSVLFVVDTTNTRPSTVGRLWIADAAAEH